MYPQGKTVFTTFMANARRGANEVDLTEDRTSYRCVVVSLRPE